MKKDQPAPSAKKKSKTHEKPRIKAAFPRMKESPVNKVNKEDVKQLLHQTKAELLEKIDLKMSAVLHRLDRVENGINEILDELRESEAMIESEPYEGQA